MKNSIACTSGKKCRLIRSPRSAFVCVPHSNFKEQASLHETWYSYFTIGNNPKVVILGAFATLWTAY